MGCLNLLVANFIIINVITAESTSTNPFEWTSLGVYFGSNCSSLTTSLAFVSYFIVDFRN